MCNLLLPGLDTTITSSLSAPATEFTELSSRKTSNVSSFFQSQLSKSSWLSSSNPYEDTLLQTKDEQTDRWEFPRHHLKFYGILGESSKYQYSKYYTFLDNLESIFPAGEGCFGQVWKCEALNIDGRKGTTMVAVKTLKESANAKEREDLVTVQTMF